MLDDHRHGGGARSRNGQCLERHVLQHSFGDDEQALACDLSCDRTEQHLAEARRFGPVLAVGPRDGRVAFLFAPLRRQPRCQPFVDASRGLFDLGAPGQFVEACDESLRHGPEVAALVAERIFEQHRVAVEDLLLDLFESERLGAGECRVARAAASDFGLDLGVTFFEVAVLGGKALCIGLARRAIA